MTDSLRPPFTPPFHPALITKKPVLFSVIPDVSIFLRSIDKLGHVFDRSDLLSLYNIYYQLESLSESLTDPASPVASDLRQNIAELKEAASQGRVLAAMAHLRSLQTRLSLLDTSRSSVTAESSAVAPPSVPDAMLTVDWSKEKCLDLIGRICQLYEGLLRPKEEQELVGFGIEEILGIKFRKKPDWRSGSFPTHEVYFATNRLSEGKDEKIGDTFGNVPSDQLSFGVTKVPCPGGRPQVDRLVQVAETSGEESFKKRLKEAVEKDERKGVLLYVHGCFSDFGRAMGYGAQISRGLDFEGPICVYSWPTVGRPSVSIGLGVIDLYRKDEVTSMESAPQLRDLIRMLSTEVGAKNVHVIAYSMGARTLLEAMRLLGPEDLGSDSGVTAHMYFMAPDASAQFFSQVARKFKFPRSRQLAPAPLPAVDAELEPREPSDDGSFSDVAPSVAPPPLTADGISKLLEQLAEGSANWIEDAVSAIRTAGRVWREGRSLGWGEFLASVFGPEEASRKLPPGDAGPARSSAHVHLYAAQNDVALLLSELMDRGAPQIRAGRRTKEFLLCNDTFDTIDASALKTGILTTGHFYIFHSVVRADMRHVVEGRAEAPMWRQVASWNRYKYWKLRQVEEARGNGLAVVTRREISVREARVDMELAPTATTCPIYWNSA